MIKKYELLKKTEHKEYWINEENEDEGNLIEVVIHDGKIISITSFPVHFGKKV